MPGTNDNSMPDLVAKRNIHFIAHSLPSRQRYGDRRAFGKDFRWASKQLPQIGNIFFDGLGSAPWMRLQYVGLCYKNAGIIFKPNGFFTKFIHNGTQRLVCRIHCATMRSDLIKQTLILYDLRVSRPQKRLEVFRLKLFMLLKLLKLRLDNTLSCRRNGVQSLWGRGEEGKGLKLRCGASRCKKKNLPLIRKIRVTITDVVLKASLKTNMLREGE